MEFEFQCHAKKMGICGLACLMNRRTWSPLQPLAEFPVFGLAEALEVGKL